MTVAELIEQLKTYPQDAEVLDCDPEGLGWHIPVGASLASVRDQHLLTGRFKQTVPVRCMANDPEARAAVLIG